MHTELDGKGSHLKVHHGNRSTIIPMHRGDLASGTYRAILKQLHLATTDLED
ncbi:type II toxin-antitoxin system HicA family toxin [Rhodopila sp.]|uniref:type II toxin-antitoxin system HicA family toxin n=1 Tax=Rhodopila sp. TaxID=2480087 RepID=UPI003D1161A0